MERTSPAYCKPWSLLEKACESVCVCQSYICNHPSGAALSLKDFSSWFMERKRNTTRLVNKTQLCWSLSFFFFMLSVCTLIFSSTIICLDTSRCPMFVKAEIDFQELEEEIGQGMVSEGEAEVYMGWSRRLLGGPGSWPPRCTSKCGKCTPCKPVHVPVPPGTPVTAEYYPEAWRCKCGNKLYMP